MDGNKRNRPARNRRRSYLSGFETSQPTASRTGSPLHFVPQLKMKKKYPTQNTLNKYGLTRPEFNIRLNLQGGTCAICKKIPTTGRWYIDHEHVKNWKNMPPEKRKLYVRGILCYFCNRFYMAKAMTKEKAENIIEYLEDYAIRQKRTI